MIQSMRKTNIGILAVILLTTGLTAHVQRRATRNSDRQVGQSSNVSRPTHRLWEMFEGEEQAP